MLKQYPTQTYLLHKQTVLVDVMLIVKCIVQTDMTSLLQKSCTVVCDRHTLKTKVLNQPFKSLVSDNFL